MGKLPAVGLSDDRPVKCIAYSERREANAVVYMRCGKQAKIHRRFCEEHGKAYREIILGITMQRRAK